MDRNIYNDELNETKTDTILPDYSQYYTDSICRDKCAICLDPSLTNIYVLYKMPISTTCVNKKSNYKYNDLSFSQCKRCNTIQLDNLVKLDVLYAESHNVESVGKLWKNYFNLISAYIFNYCDNKNVLEIGCPSGKIAMNLNNYKKWSIVDMNKNDKINFKDNIHFIKGIFNESFIINDSIDLIVHSHLFEHIYEPNNFLNKCFEILSDDGCMIFGVPNMQTILDNNLCLFQGIFFEHTIFLNKDNISYMLNNNGFEIENIIDYSNHSTIYHVSKRKNRICPQLEFKLKNNYDNFKNTIEYYKKFILDCNNKLNESNKKAYLFSASYNTQLLIEMGLNKSRIEGIIDNSIEKQNKYFYGYNLLVFNPDVLKNEDCIVILKNSFYVNEITEQINNLNINTVICS